MTSGAAVYAAAAATTSASINEPIQLRINDERPYESSHRTAVPLCRGGSRGPAQAGHCVCQALGFGATAGDGLAKRVSGIATFARICVRSMISRPSSQVCVTLYGIFTPLTSL